MLKYLFIFFAVTAIPPNPYFKTCDETNTYEIALPVDNALLNLTASVLKLEALDGNNQTIPIFIIDEVLEESVRYILLPKQNQTLRFEAGDSFGRYVSCFVKLAIIGKRAGVVVHIYSQSSKNVRR